MKNRIIIIGAIVIIGISIIGCGSKEEGGKKIAITNEEEVKETQESTKIDYSTIEDFSVLEKTWKKTIHSYPEPPEELKDYSSTKKTWMIPYKYKGVEVWVVGNSDADVNGRTVYLKRTNDWKDINKIEDKLAELTGLAKDLPIYEVWGMLHVGQAAIDTMTENAPIKNVTK